MTKLRNFTKGEIPAFTACPFSLQKITAIYGVKIYCKYDIFKMSKMFKTIVGREYLEFVELLPLVLLRLINLVNN